MVLREYYFSTQNAATFVIQPQVYCAAWKILEVSFTQDWDLVHERNNQIRFVEEGSSDIKTAVIPTGTYTIADFPQAIADAMTAAGSGTYTVAYSHITKRLTVSSPGTQYKILGSSRGTSASLLRVTSSSSMLAVPTERLHKYNSGAETGINVLACIMPDRFGDVVTYQSNSDFVRCGKMLSKVNFILVDSSTMQEVPSNAPVTVKVAILDDEGDLYEGGVL
ncbi:hypothetical protein HK104_009131 [Borealophlyctis nickersoniae]|nr:hypothetical protein HK104_009131 [Borealophlyctis nickersoniae]